MSSMKIGDVSERSGVGIETIRYYERQGLLDEPKRLPSGYRHYDADVLSRLQFIRRAKTLGFTLSEIKDLLGLWFEPNTRCAHVRQRASDKIADIEARIRALHQMKRSLRKVVEQCRDRTSLEQCPLFEELAPNNAED